MTDRDAIYDVLVRYAEGIDRRDFDAVASCFAPDARARYSGIDVGPGVDAILDFLQTHLVGSAASTHFVGNVQLAIDDERASCTSATIAVHLTARPEEGTRAAIRGLRYHDRLERADGAWRIVERVHEPRWMAEFPGQLLG